MTCPACGAPIASGHRFCTACGVVAVAGSACGRCGLAADPGARFCGGCGAPLGADGPATPGRHVTGPWAPAGPGAVAASGGQGVGTAAPGGTAGSAGALAPAGRSGTSTAETTHGSPHARPVAERRVVTVLFADLVGFTTFSEGRDSEAVREMLSHYFEMGREIIARHGGTVEKFIGDAVMAVWGAPIAREDDPERAVRAGVELVAAIPSLGDGISARVGILTGEAAVTLGAVGEGMVAGDIVNTAARIQAAAEPGAVFAGEATVRSVGGAVEFEAVGAQQMKGKAAPVPVWRVVRIGGGGAGVVSVPFVGRDAELRMVIDLYEATRREERVRLVSVIGPGGIGKSRLSWEFLRHVDSSDEFVLWHSGRCPSYGDAVSFRALAEMVRQRCFLLEEDGEATTRERIATKAAELFPDETERAWVERALLVLLGLETGLGADQLFAAWRTFFERMAAVAPVVLVFEDLHFADPGLLDFIDHLTDHSRGLPIYLLTMARTDLLEKRPTWGAGKRHFSSVFLEPLPAERMREMLGLVVPGLPEPVTERIVERSAGMPLYAVETIRKLVADGSLEQRDGVWTPVGDLDRIAVPESIQALIASRLDALDPDDRALVSDASVLGQSFAPAALAAVSGIPPAVLELRLDGLVRREILVEEEDPQSPLRGWYSFVQALVREVAYNTLARRDRRSRHLAFAGYLESLRSPDVAGILAAQYTAAAEHTTDAAEAAALAERARLHLHGAAERAAALGSDRASFAFLEQALDLGGGSGERGALLEEAGVAAGHAGRYEEAERLLREALAAHRDAGDRPGMLRVSAAIAEHPLLGMGRLREADDAIGEALIEYGDLADDPAYVTVAGLQARLLLTLDADAELALPACERAIELAERAGLEPLVADLLITKGTLLGRAGRRREATALVAGGAALAERHDLVHARVRAAAVLAELTEPDAPAEALAIAEGGRALARRLAGAPVALELLATATRLGVRTGGWPAAERLAQEAPESVEDLPGALVRLALAWPAILRGRLGADVLTTIRAIVEPSGDHAALARLGEAEVAIALLAGRPRDALAIAGRIPTGGPAAALAACTAARAALVARDEAAALAAATRHAELTRGGAGGRVAANERLLHEAGLAALAGRAGDALDGFRAADAGWQALGLPVDRGIGTLVLVSVMDGHDPAVAALALEAREALRLLGAPALVARIETVIARGRRPEAAGA